MDRLRVPNAQTLDLCNPSIPAMPPHLSRRAKKLWPQVTQLIDFTGVLTATDVLAVETLVECYAEIIDCCAALRKRGGRTYESNGLVKAYPEVAQLNDLNRQLATWLSRFGLTPSDRAKVGAVVDAPRNDFDEL